MAEEKHYLSVLTESELFPRLRACDESNDLSNEEKEKIKHKIKESFISDCINIFKTMKEEEIRERVDCVLERTKTAIDKINKFREDNER